jgi:hypothetical protein
MFEIERVLVIEDTPFPVLLSTGFTGNTGLLVLSVKFFGELSVATNAPATMSPKTRTPTTAMSSFCFGVK